MQQDRRTQNLQAIEWNDRDLLAEIARLRSAIKNTIESNLHLADGDNCRLIELKRAINYDRALSRKKLNNSLNN